MYLGLMMKQKIQLYIFLIFLSISLDRPFVKCNLDNTNDTQYVKGLRFTTDLIADRGKSLFMENYVSIYYDFFQHHPTEISFCFRWQFYSMVGQCFFQETNIGIFFKKPSIHRVGYVILFGAYIMFEVPKNVKFVPLVWHHLCVSYKDYKVLIVMDGLVLLDKVISHFHSLDSEDIVLKDDVLLARLQITGYCRDDHHRKGDPMNGILRGEMTDFYIASQSLSLSEMINFTTWDCRHNMNVFDKYSSKKLIDWKNLNIVRKGSNVEIIQLDRDEVCRDKNEETVLISSIKRNYSNSKQTCQQIGGSLYYPTSQNDIKNLTSHLMKNNHLVSENITEIINFCGLLFWIPIRQLDINDGNTKEHEIRWYEDKGVGTPKEATFVPWLFGQPNGGNKEPCVMLDYQQESYYDTGCKEARCALCHFKGPVHFLMHGIPNESSIDRQYIFIPQEQKTQTVEMIGYTGNKIEWDEENKQWVIRDSNNISGNILAYLNISKVLLPIGRNLWYKKGSTDENVDEPLPLKLSRCNPKDEFTCWDGGCVPLIYECDEVPDCVDHSDEIDCEIVKIDPRSYRKEYPPMLKDDEKISVNVSMNIDAISNIHDIKESFQAKFTIILKWFDTRLKFYFLRNATTSNLIGGEEKGFLWIPPLIFNNTDSNQMIVDDPSTQMFVLRKGEGEPFEISNVNEGETFKGSENPLLFASNYILTHHCVFELYLYPFDTQKCEIQIKVPLAMQKYIRLVQGEVNYTGESTLVQFQIQKPRMVLKADHFLVVEISFKRMFQYHLLSTFLPTLSLLLVSLITMYIDESHFEATIMVSLTSMLVMYTLFQSHTDSLPQTAYIKMIDVWFLHGLVVPFLVFILEVATEMAHARQRRQNNNKKQDPKKIRSMESKSNDVSPVDGIVPHNSFVISNPDMQNLETINILDSYNHEISEDDCLKSLRQKRTGFWWTKMFQFLIPAFSFSFIIGYGLFAGGCPLFADLLKFYQK